MTKQQARKQAAAKEKTLKKVRRVHEKLREKDELLQGKFGPLHEIRVFQREYKDLSKQVGAGSKDEQDDQDADIDFNPKQESEDEEVENTAHAMSDGEDEHDDSDDNDDPSASHSSTSSPSKAGTASQGLMKCFWDLASLSPNERINAGATILSILKAR